MQDVCCQRCNEVRSGDMSNLCECAGRFKVMEDPNKLQTFLRTLRQIAKFYEMNHLLATMDWIVGSGLRKSAAIKIDRDAINI